MATVIPFRPAREVNAPLIPTVPQQQSLAAGLPSDKRIVAAAMRSFMDGDPLTEREQRIVDLVVDANYFGQLGRLAFGG